MSSNLFDLSGKTALITGATHGLGLAMAVGLAEAGARIIINGHTPSKLDKVIRDLHGNGINASGYLFDITNSEVNALLAKVFLFVFKSWILRRDVLSF